MQFAPRMEVDAGEERLGKLQNQEEAKNTSVGRLLIIQRLRKADAREAATRLTSCFEGPPRLTAYIRISTLSTPMIDHFALLNVLFIQQASSALILLLRLFQIGMRYLR